MDVSRWIDRHAEFQGAHPAIRFEGETIAYAGLAEMIAARARVLKHAFGVGRGDRVAFLGLNGPEFLAQMFAAARLGALFIPLNWRLAAPEHLFILKDSAARVLLCEDDFRAHAESFRASAPDCEFVACDFAGPGWHGLAEALAGAGGDDANPHVSLSSPLLLVYTSGTTGHPKGAVLTQEALLFNALNSLHMHAMTGDDRILGVLPLFHVGGLNIQTTPALYAGATVSLQRRFDPGATLAALRDEATTLCVLVPATMAACIGHPAWAATDLSALRMLTTGSSVVPMPLINAFHGRGIPVVQVYGSTETSPIATYQRAGDAFTTAGSAGRTALHCQVRVIDEAGEPLPPGTSGEVAVRGPNVMYEYWGNAEATAASLRDGWFLTGDVGYFSEAGFLYIVDRKKDVVISGGENVYPAELEAVLHGLPGIREAAVVGRADPRWGEVPVACVVPAGPEAPSRDAILAAFEGRLARYKHPKDVVFLDALPRNVMGKVQKFELRRRLGPF